MRLANVAPTVPDVLILDTGTDRGSAKASGFDHLLAPLIATFFVCSSQGQQCAQKAGRAHKKLPRPQEQARVVYSRFYGTSPWPEPLHGSAVPHPFFTSQPSCH